MANVRRLGERLVQAGVIDAAQLRRALEAQVISGTRLGTNLVQLEGLDLDDLARALAAQHGVPAATGDRFGAIAPSAIACFGAAVAAQHQAVPIAFGAKGALEVAMVDPRRELVDALQRAARITVIPLVAAELRIAYQLEEHYGVKRPTRFLRGDRAPAGPKPDERRRFVEPNPPLPPAPVSSSPVVGTTMARIAPVKRATVSPAPVAPAPDDFDLPIVVDNRRQSAGACAAVKEIERAASGAELGDAVVGYLRGHVGSGLVMVVRTETAIGWRAHAQIDDTTAQAIVVPLYLPTALHVAWEARTTYAGPPPTGGESWHDRLSEILGSRPARAVAVVPICTEDRVAGLIYAQMADGGAVPEPIVADLEAIATALVAAMARLGAEH